MTAVLLKPQYLGGVFHAFSQRANAQTLSERSNGSHDGSLLDVFTFKAGQRAIDFDLVERKACELAQRGVPCSKIVHCEPHLHLAQIMQGLENDIIVPEQDAFCDLDLESLAR